MKGAVGDLVVNKAMDEWKVLYKPGGSKRDEKEVKVREVSTGGYLGDRYYELRDWCSEEE